ncbi:claudin-20 [Gastrophryne carolinensis]
MASVRIQVFAFAAALLGTCAAICGTLLPNWKVNADAGANIITAVTQMQGLWIDCTWYSTGMFSCNVKYSILSLPIYIQAVRIIMVLSCIMSTLGIWVSLAGMKCTKLVGNQQRERKNSIAFAGGICFLLAAIFAIISVSWYMKEIIFSYLDSSIPGSGKHEPGGGLYVVFISAGMHFLSGAIFCASCTKKQPNELRPRPKRAPELASQQPENSSAGCNLQDYV